MRFLFVHGTGVRRDGYDPLFELVSRELLARFPGAETVPCYWGDEYGATLGAGGASIPGFTPTAAAPDDGGWSLLYVDPLCELRVLAELPVEDGGFDPPGFRSPGEAVADRLALLVDGSDTRGDLAGLAGLADLADLLAATGLEGRLAPAVREIADSPEFAEACERARDEAAAAELTTATARAVVAGAVTAAGPCALCTADERDRLVELVADQLGGTARGALGRAAGVLGRLGLRLLVQPQLERRRGALTTGASPAVGDILRYQARGGPLRAFLGERIGAAPGPTVVIGHSLGGIALVDHLALAAARGEAPEGLRLLVTVGSQAPYLHELGALNGLEPGAALPPGFPDWLNVYDPGDLLGYCAAPVFPGDARVTDHEVTSRQPFPYCHSAYFKLPALYDRIAAALAGPALGAAG
ncbi:hypothetical protein [Kitasatospora sp. NPDC101183]|uniref:hypothetical protein n=1 Tax=Kitasatospora sp. NPDC101183 TaxID=3364100 RepID=UPI0038011AB2